LRGSATSSPNGAGPGVPDISGTSYTREHSIRNNNQILHTDETRA